MATREEQPDSLYGSRAPVNLSIYGYILVFVICVALAFTLATCVLVLFWGDPPGDSFLDLRPMRLVFGALVLVLLAAIGFSHLSAMLVRLRGLFVASVLMLTLFATVPIYSPHYFILALRHALATDSVVELSMALVSFIAGAGLTVAGAHAILEGLRFKGTSTHGSTAWGDGAALKEAKKGLLLGWHEDQLLRYDGDGHLLTVAATRSGKGVGAIIPNLLTYPGSVVVTDPKGENCYVTARHRREKLKQTVVALDPFGLTAPISLEFASFNPLDLIDLKGPDYVETAMMIAEMLVVQRGMTIEPHWDREGKALLFAFILYVASLPDRSRRHLIEVRRLLTQSPKELEKMLAQMEKSEIEQVREGAGRIQQKADRERSGVFSTAQSHTHFLSSPRMEKVLTSTNFDLKGLLGGKLTLYLVLPREHLTTFAGWLRLMVSCCYYTCTHNALQRQRTDRRVLFLLDEFANLGYMANLKEAVSLGGGYGLTLWLVLQDLAQLRREYKDEWESFVANSDVIQAFAIQDPFTSDRISKMLGEKTVWLWRVRAQGRREGGRYLRDFEERSRPLIRADELRRLNPQRQILLVRPYQPIAADKIFYYRDSIFRQMHDSNPYITPLETMAT